MIRRYLACKFLEIFICKKELCLELRGLKTRAELFYLQDSNVKTTDEKKDQLLNEKKSKELSAKVKGKQKRKSRLL